VEQYFAFEQLYSEELHKLTESITNIYVTSMQSVSCYAMFY